jgi:hypothetical protein
MLLEYPPEPCLDSSCCAPTACSGFGYCRERNLKEGAPNLATSSREVIDEFMAKSRAEARASVAATIEHDRLLGRY